jgi:hypothetical protein
MDEKKLVVVPITYDADEIWSDVFGSGYEYCPWWVGVKYSDGADWDKHGVATIKHWGKEDEDVLEVTKITIEDIAKAYATLTADNWTHCGGCGLSAPDGCSSDVVLQMAVYGEIVYG